MNVTRWEPPWESTGAEAVDALHREFAIGVDVVEALPADLGKSIAEGRTCRGPHLRDNPEPERETLPPRVHP